ncbi:MAG: hypothetical protein Q4F69_08950 [Bacteroidia bacterium]|nr:hypothetical protein [Bacteroidia bacterium]
METEKLSKECYLAPETKVTSFVADQGYAVSTTSTNAKITLYGGNL